MTTSISIKKVLVGIAATVLLASPLFALADNLSGTFQAEIDKLSAAGYSLTNAVVAALVKAKAAADYCENHHGDVAQCRGALARAATGLAFLVDPILGIQYRQPLTKKQKDSLTDKDGNLTKEGEERERLKNAAQQALDALEAEIARLDAKLAAELVAQRAKTAEIEALNEIIESKQAAGDKNQKQPRKADASDGPPFTAVHEAIAAAAKEVTKADGEKRDIDRHTVKSDIENADKQVTAADKTNKGEDAQKKLLGEARKLLVKALNALGEPKENDSTETKALRTALKNAIGIIDSVIENFKQPKPVVRKIDSGRLRLSVRTITDSKGKKAIEYTVSNVNLELLPLKLKFSRIKNGMQAVIATVLVTRNNCKKNREAGAKAQGTCTVMLPATPARLLTAIDNVIVEFEAKGKVIGTTQPKNGTQAKEKTKKEETNGGGETSQGGAAAAPAAGGASFAGYTCSLGLVYGPDGWNYGTYKCLDTNGGRLYCSEPNSIQLENNPLVCPPVPKP